MLDICVLGGLTAEVDGRRVELPADARARELLGWLAVARGLHSRSAAAGRLRPDVAEESARKTLRDAVYELRRAFGPAAREAVVATRDQIGLREDAVRVDLWEFRRLRAANELEAAVARCRGELLAGMDADWILRAREEQAAELADTLGLLAARAQSAGDLRAAIGWVRRRLEVEPLAEDGHRELVRLLALTDDRPAALAAAATLSERLRRELGVPPSAETRALIEDVKRGRVGPLPTAAGTPAPPLPAPLARTARPEGREPALARLQAAWTDASAGGLRLALVTGDPASGRPRSPGRWPAGCTRRARRSFTGAATSRRWCPTNHGWRHSSACWRSFRPQRSATGWRRSTAPSRGCCPRAARAARRRTARASGTSRSRRCATCSSGRPSSTRCYWCSTTCTGPMRTR